MVSRAKDILLACDTKYLQLSYEDWACHKPLSFVSIVAFADDIYFIPEVRGRQYFECTVSDGAAQVKMDTHNVDGQGFCPGRGHLVVDGNTVNSSFFVVDNAGGRPKVTVSIINGKGTITCRNLSGTDNSRQEYGTGQGFCALPEVTH